MTLSLPFIKGGYRQHIQSALIIACGIATIIFFQQIIAGQSKPTKIHSAVSQEKAESVLRTMSIINVGFSRTYEMTPGVGGTLRDDKGREHTALEMSKTGLNTYFKAADAALEKAIKANPSDNVVKAKLVVLLSVWGKHRDSLISVCEQLKAAKDPTDAKLGLLLWKVCANGVIEDNDLSADEKLIEEKLKTGWYQENALLALYRAGKNHKQYAIYSKELEERYFNTFKTGATLAALGCFFGFIGIVVVMFQLGTLGRREAVSVPEEDRLDLKVSGRTILTVFVGWMASQLAIGEFFKLLADPHINFKLSLGGNPLGIAAFSFVSYLVTMLPALLLIYFVALKPQGLSPLAALRLRFKTGSAGPARLIATGFLAWCAIIPLVVTTSAISAALGSTGSDNPILPQIAMIAGSKNYVAVGLLLATVAVLAPICEEIIFRGFLYSGLRGLIGIFPAILVSSFVFAGIHCDTGGMLMLLSLGPVLALAFERSRSLIPSMIAHGLWNGGAFTVTLILFCA